MRLKRRSSNSKTFRSSTPGEVRFLRTKVKMKWTLPNGRRKLFDAGAVAFVRNVKNPVKLARLVMEKTEHILLAAKAQINLRRK